MRRGASGISLLLGIDKPAGPTSHDVVASVRRALGERRVGHAGTLDPAATGVMVVGVGQATRLLGLVTADRKRYLARIAFGSETDTDDAEGAVTRTAAVPARLADEAFARDALASIVGTCEQVPPAYSAISVGGERSYDLARKGRAPDLAPRVVTVFAADLVAVGGPQGARGDAELSWTCVFEVSKGTYVRAIARDLGRSLGTCAHLAELRRLSSGLVGLEDCVSLERLAELGAGGVAAAALDPTRVLGLPVRHLDAAERADAACGRALQAAGFGRGRRCSLVAQGTLVGVWESDGRRLRSVVNLPEGVGGVRA